MNAPRLLGQAALRLSCIPLRCASGRRAYGSHSFQPYPLYPNNSLPPARGEGIPEGTISTPDPLPKVNETRPPRMPSRTAFQESSSSNPGSSSNSKTKTTEIRSATASESSQGPSASSPGAAVPTPEVSEQAAQTSNLTSRPQRNFRPRKAAMKLSPAAVDKLRGLLDQPEPKLIKVGVRNKGCSGLAYHLEYVDKPGSFDEEVVQDGVKVLIDSKALFSIIGSEMDWIEDKLSQRFVFKNPNIKEQCGCGESFMV